MPWQLFGNGRSDWSTKLTRGLEAEAAAGFQSRRGRCREPTPVTPQYATFQTYKATRVHYASRERGGDMAARSTGATARTDPARRHPRSRNCRRRGFSGLDWGVPSGAGAIGLDHWPQPTHRHALATSNVAEIRKHASELA